MMAKQEDVKGEKRLLIWIFCIWGC